MQYVRKLLAGAVVLAAGAIIAASAFGGSGSAIVKVGPSNLGRVLVDAHGKTLYLWAHDKTAKSTCNGDCAEYWPPLVTSGKPRALAGANPKLIGTQAQRRPLAGDLRRSPALLLRPGRQGGSDEG
jgi:predicted lipoprotein with Yx(FWY)xxD motif